MWGCTYVPFPRKYPLTLTCAQDAELTNAAAMAATAKIDFFISASLFVLGLIALLLLQAALK
ncbi:MAG: hypothetical protein A2W61_02265 [Deltaproteobacteria bacterium RIFCSPLOWO2_01_44_7]|nr:MAG: hypothetical protein A2712_05040 [Deltaproteobacteria bacterium RIFCSPHIGHO2_01_FULL_43_49]OGQ15953.1 MAG: hypothetical protein A3D22_07800 [Deltaproteobacteria bacterium RIFCSPHIGHO2_02_FULL_44_53]OGQ29378.1 MAG: hypothetical protein A3D98_00915 [Deltaproteobacteria bacterium RIFCSPHIGHO2_12_FULL_44_21]OGQ31007.1 MAG: hypothetical protein A2979_02190 [Deltaproteobacteria bacterium RIFCSPLOWO2_01_FULL_45_74]OGQ37787.1 MAG: hypothetical protein A2W61_02265 [Deltaproteobacteria bacterium 